jgi:hypothetical protein
MITQTLLSDKYNWLQWLTIVYDGIDGSNVHGGCVKSNSNSYSWRTQA